jgi:hypothetical protein
MAYIYRHIRLDKNIPFYIGIGKDDKNGSFPRAYSSKRKNSHWHYIISKTDYKVEIMIDDISWETAKEKEKEFIALYGRSDKKNGILCNQTDGGDGWAGHVMKEEAKEKIRDFQLSLNKKVKPGRKWTKESKEKLSRTISGFKHSEESKSKMRKPKPVGFGEKIAEIKKGKPGKKAKRIFCSYCQSNVDVNIFARFHGDSCKLKPGNESIYRGPEKIQCPHCLSLGNSGPMKQWHFDRCRIKSITESVRK